VAVARKGVRIGARIAPLAGLKSRKGLTPGLWNLISLELAIPKGTELDQRFDLHGELR
jgi:hypothetical protein